MRHNVQLRVPQPAFITHPADDTDYLRWRINELEASERRHRALVEKSADVTALVAPNGTILYQSPSVSHILGYGPQELTGRSLFEHVHPQDAELTSSAWSLIIQMPGRSQPLSFRYRHKDGAWRSMEGVGTNQLHEPEVQAVVINFHDVTAARLAAERILSLNQHLQQQADDLRDLNRAMQLISEAMSPDALYRVLIHHARTLTHADAAVLLRRNPEDGVLWCARAEPDGRGGPELPQAAAHAIVDRVIGEAQPVVVADTAIDATTDELLDQLTGVPARAVLATPLMRLGTVEGILASLCEEPRVYAEHDRYVMSALAGAAAITLENVRLLAAERAQRRLAETFREVGSTLAQSLDAQAVLDRIIREMPRVVPSDAVSIMQLDGSDLRLVGWGGYEAAEPQRMAAIRVDLERSAALARVIHNRESVITGDMQSDSGWDLPPALRPYRSCVAVPICARETVAGCLTASSSEPDHFRPADAAHLRMLADQVAIALSNARLYGQMEQAATEAKAVAHRLAEAQEKERRRIAREIHDEAGQSLTSILVQLKMLETSEQPFEKLRQQADQARRQVSEVLDNLHQLATRLRPPALDHLGLVASLRQQAVLFKRQYGVDMSFEVVDLTDERFPAEIETALYRFVQEALTNVARHAGARRVDIILERRDAKASGSELVAIVEDDGCGFDVDAAKHAGRLGLLGMEERVTALGGRVLIESLPGCGATLFAQIPWSPAAPGTGSSEATVAEGALAETTQECRTVSL